MSSYDYYIWIRSLGEFIVTLLPILILLGVIVAALLGWRWWLTARHGDPQREKRLQAKVAELEERVERLEELNTTQTGRG